MMKNVRNIEWNMRMQRQKKKYAAVVGITKMTRMIIDAWL